MDCCLGTLCQSLDVSRKHSHFLHCLLNQVLTDAPRGAAELKCSRVNAIAWDVSVPSASSLRKVKGAVPDLMSRAGEFFSMDKTVSLWQISSKYSQTHSGALIESSLSPDIPKDLDMVMLHSGSFPKEYHYLTEK